MNKNMGKKQMTDQSLFEATIYTNGMDKVTEISCWVSKKLGGFRTGSWKDLETVYEPAYFQIFELMNSSSDNS